MKILISMLATDKYPNRLKLVSSGSVRSKSGAHDVIFNMTAEGKKPDFLDDRFNWLNCEDIFISHRVLFGMERALECKDWDYVVFCDDDCVIDIDRFVEQAESSRGVPTLWYAHPGMGCNPELAQVIRKHASGFLVNKNLNDLFMGFCTTVYNRSMMELLDNNREALRAVWKISEEFWGQHMVGDCQAPLLGYLLGAHPIRGDRSNCSCWPAFMSSSLLCKTGKMWHVHGLRESKEDFCPRFTQECMLNLVQKSPQDREKVLETWFDTLVSGVKSKDWSDRQVHFHRQMVPWTHWRLSREHILMHEPPTVLDSKSGKIKLPHGIYEWEPCQGGFRILDHHRSLVFKWHDPGEKAVFGIVEKTSGSVHDSEIYGLWLG
jgi:hypothetical protein